MLRCRKKSGCRQGMVYTHPNMVQGTSWCVSEDAVSQRLQPTTSASESADDAMDLAGLKKHSSALNSAMRRSLKAQKGLKKKLAEELRQESRETQMRMDVAFVLLVRQNGDVTRSLEYLKQAGHSISNAESESPQEQLEHRFLRTPLPEMQQILEGGGLLKRKAFTIADRWQEEHSFFPGLSPKTLTRESLQVRVWWSSTYPTSKSIRRRTVIAAGGAKHGRLRKNGCRGFAEDGLCVGVVFLAGKRFLWTACGKRYSTIRVWVNHVC